MIDTDNTFLIGPFAQIVTMDDMPLKGPLNDNQLVVLKNAGLYIQNSVIGKVAAWDALKKEFPNLKVKSVSERSVLFPGFIDAHTHICFAGNRSADFAARNNGVSYQEIAAAGGGIWHTVTHTRDEDLETLVRLTMQRANRLISDGITTIEVKSGYGLNAESELKILRAINQVSQQLPATIIPTCLAAHIIPKDFDGTEADYLQYIIEEIVPVVRAEKLTNRFDIFIEENAFSVDLSAEFLRKIKTMGFDLTVHGDQFTTGGSKVAVDAGALSVDHLEVSGSEEIEYLAKSNTIATALPGASLGIGCGFTPARQLLDAGCCLAIASDWNPGSAPMGDLITQASILACYEKLSSAEVFAAITFRAAAALNLNDRGIIKPGFKADFVSYVCDDYRDVLYQQGSLKPNQCWIDAQAML